VADLTPEHLAHTGSGWGRIELALRSAEHPTGTPFPEVEDDSQALAQLVRTGDQTGLDAMPVDRPTPPVISDRWVARLEEALTESDSPTGWWVPYALATARHVRGDREGAHTAYRQSIERHPTAVALRGLALLADGPPERVQLLRQALTLAPGDRRLAIELLTSLLEADEPAEVVATVHDLPDALRGQGRIQLLLAQALALSGDDDAALAILTDLEVPDLAEGDQALSDLWTRLRPGEVVPARLDFRMSVTPD
jgi:hypothetical protein